MVDEDVGRMFNDQCSICNVQYAMLNIGHQKGFEIFLLMQGKKRVPAPLLNKEEDY